MGFKLLKEMQSDGHVPGVVTYNALMNGLCKQGQVKNAKMLLDAILEEVPQMLYLECDPIPETDEIEASIFYSVLFFPFLLYNIK